MIGGALERGGKEGQDRLLIRNQPTIFFLFFSNSPDQPLSKALFWPLCVSQVFWSGTWLGKRGYCTGVAGWQWGGMSRASFSVPPPCNQFLTLPNISLLLPFQCRQARTQYQKSLTSPVCAVRAPVLLGMLPCTPVPFYSSACLA